MKSFTKEERPLSISDKDFDDASERLIAKGLMEKVMVDGKVNYRLTTLGLQVGKQMEDKTPSHKRN